MSTTTISVRGPQVARCLRELAWFREATPAQKRAVRADVDAFLADGLDRVEVMRCLGEYSSADEYIQDAGLEVQEDADLSEREARRLVAGIRAARREADIVALFRGDAGTPRVCKVPLANLQKAGAKGQPRDVADMMGELFRGAARTGRAERVFERLLTALVNDGILRERHHRIARMALALVQKVKLVRRAEVG